MKLLSGINDGAEYASNRINAVNQQHKFRYIPGFDFLRGFAVLLVLLLHGSYGFFKGGWIGVDLFFVLSGYLITSLLLNEYQNSGEIAISKFYIRRALRLFPALIVCIIMANALWPLTNFYGGAIQKRATIAALFYFTNLIPGDISGNMEHLWSLSVEEHFYFIFPVLASFFLFKISLRNCIIFLLLFIFGISTFRICVYNNILRFADGFLVIDTYRFTLCRIDSILFGSVLAVVLSRINFKEVTIKKNLATLYLIVILALFVIVLFTVNHQNIFWNNGGFIFTNLLCLSAVLIVTRNPFHFLLSNKIFRWIGKRSYGIYLYHFPIFQASDGLRQHHSLVNFLLVTIFRFGITFLLAEVSYKYIEQPILKIKKRYEVSKVIDVL
ncbi:MAG: acyltransferase [Bacteroidota bacterium]|nr:acyltransferase [Bacteroidota bacterium]